MRGGESGRLHNPEFTLIEWYRVGFSLSSAHGRGRALVRALLPGRGARRTPSGSVIARHSSAALGLDPFSDSAPELARAAAAAGFTGRRERRRAMSVSSC